MLKKRRHQGIKLSGFAETIDRNFAGLMYAESGKSGCTNVYTITFMTIMIMVLMGKEWRLFISNSGNIGLGLAACIRDRPL